MVWITGASSGIGEHLAYVCASTGAKLALSGTNRERLENVAKKCIGNNLPFSYVNLLTSNDFLLELGKYDDSNILVVPFDMTDYDCHQQKLDLVLAHFKKVKFFAYFLS